MAHASDRTLLGVAALVLGILVFSVQDALIKALSSDYAVTQVVAVRAVVALPVLLLFVHAEGGVGRLVTPHFWFLSLRGLLLLVAYTTYYMAFPALPLATAIALFFTAPLFLTLLAGLTLGERIGLGQVVSVLLGFAGVAVMTNPGAGLFEPAVFLALASAFFYAVAMVLARRIGVEEPASVMAFFQNWVYLAGAVLIAALCRLLEVPGAAHPSLDFLVRPWAWPTLLDLSLMAACGIIAAIAMSLLTFAYRVAKASVVAVFEYTGMVWTPLWGFLFWAEIPGWTVGLGALMIAGAGFVALLGPLRQRPSRSSRFASLQWPDPP